MMNDRADEPRPSDPRRSDRFVVGLGASAGGIGALQQFFARVSPDSGLTYIVILHLSPDHESHLAEVLQPSASIAVTQVTETTRIEPNHVYVVPPNRSLEISGGSLTLWDFTRLEQRRSPVDLFFRTLADTHGPDAACVILSGTGPNGSAGLKAVKEQGGLVLAQDPAEARYSDMPRNAIATGLVDLVLPVADMAGRLAEYFARLRNAAPVGDADRAAAGSRRDHLRDVLATLRARTGHDFSNYKHATLERRIERRIAVRGLDSIGTYARFIREEPDEAPALMRELLISVTAFFRDPEAFAVLQERALPRLFRDRHGADQLRVWVPACATGEEAYSIAMLLVEYADGVNDPPTLQVFATDLDEQAVAVGRDGLYSDADVGDLSEERLRRFFQREAGGYRVRRDLREMILFAHHNVIKDPPFSHLDLITCRNLLIYLNRAIQGRVIETFHFALRPGGYLFLGTSEQPESDDLFVAVDKNAHIYESRSVTSRIALPMTDRVLPPATRLPKIEELTARFADRIAPAELHQRLLEQYAPPSLVTTEDHLLVHVSDRAARFLRVPPGEASRDALRLILPELRADLRHALYEAGRQRSSVEVMVPAAGELARPVTLTVRPVLQDGDPARGYFVVLFEEGTAASEPPPVALGRPADGPSVHLEEELGRVRMQLRTTIVQYETQVEEVKASNEELQAMNEELWSATEELETSKEELQSVNEELTTVNQELKIKIEELALSNNNFQNLINSTDIGTIFLDRTLHLKMITPRIADVFNVLPSDIGRPLSHITNKLVDDWLHRDIEQVLKDLTAVEREVPTSDGRWFLLRVLPYRTTDDGIDGIVITLQDVTNRRTAEQRAQTGAELQTKIGELQTAEREIATLVRRLIEKQERQRARMARNLHDQLGQQLTALRLLLERHRAEGAPEAASAMDEALAIARRLDDDLDFLAWELRPSVLDDLGLPVALPQYVAEWSKRYDVSGECHRSPLVAGELSHEAEVVLYRVAQEALNNVLKHGHATRVDVILEKRDHSILLVVEDDGVGFDLHDEDLASRGLGLIGMRERATLIGGTLEVESRPGNGTSVYLRVPVTRRAGA